MFDDDAARRVLQALADESEPPVATTFDQVLKRGRRRVFMQRAGAVAGVVAVVAAIGIGALLLRPGEPSGNGVRVADTPTSSTSTTSATGAPESTRTTQSTPPPPTILVPGWMSPAPVAGVSCGIVQAPPAEPDVALRPEGIVKDKFADAVAVVRGPVLTVKSEWRTVSPKHDNPRGYVTAEVLMDNGNGQLKLETGRFAGTPEEAADASIFGYGDCVLPQRRVLADGTVMQLYSVRGGREAPVQHVQIYRPDGLFYIIGAAGYSAADVVDVPDSTSTTIVGGRGKLPTTQDQLAGIAERFVTNLE